VKDDAMNRGTGFAGVRVLSNPANATMPDRFWVPHVLDHSNSTYRSALTDRFPPVVTEIFGRGESHHSEQLRLSSNNDRLRFAPLKKIPEIFLDRV